MHGSVYAWVKEHADGCVAPVLEVGSYNVNGSVRDLFPTPYRGIDIVHGPGVDHIYDGRTLPYDNEYFGTVVSTEVFEHCEDPVRLANEIVRVLKPGGTLLVTARGVKFEYHNPPDRWRFMPGALAELFSRHGCVTTEYEDPEASGWFVIAHKPAPE